MSQEKSRSRRRLSPNALRSSHLNHRHARPRLAPASPHPHPTVTSSSPSPSPSPSPLPSSGIGALVRVCGPTLLEMDLNSVDELTDHIVPVIAKSCQTIQGADFGYTQLTNDAIRWLSTKLPFATKDEENGTRCLVPRSALVQRYNAHVLRCRELVAATYPINRAIRCWLARTWTIRLRIMLTAASITAQRAARGFLGRLEAKRRRRAVGRIHGHVGAFRRRRTRALRKAEKLLEEARAKARFVAAAHGQRLWRGMKGRRRAAHIRSRRDHAYRNWTKTVVRLSAKRYAESVERKARVCQEIYRRHKVSGASTLHHGWSVLFTILPKV